MGAVVVEGVESTYEAALGGLIVRDAITQVAFESDHVTVAGLVRWQAAAALSPSDWRASADLVERLRLIKDLYEIAIFRRAGAALADVAGQLGGWVSAGRSERQVAADINRGLDRAGFSHPAFDTIVASGPNSAHPHARPSDRRLARGDLVVLDFGGVLDGYCVDLTRMAAVGRVGDEALRIYRVVREAQQAALDMICAGVTAGAVDAAARQVLEAQGLGAALCMEQAMDSVGRFTRRRDCRAWRFLTIVSWPAWSAPLSLAHMSQGSAGHGWRTTCS